MDPLLSLHHYAIPCFLLPLLLASFSLQQSSFLEPTYIDCLRNVTNSLPTTFSSNLQSTLRNFTSLSAQGTTYAIASSDALYATFQCRGDLSSQSCDTCMQNVTAWLPLACPLAVGARIRLDGCFLRYDNQSFFDPDFSPIYGGCNVVSSSDPVLLTEISDAMVSVISEAPKSSKRFASSIQNGVFATAECWRHLNESQCADCLSTYPYRMVCNATVGERLLLANCDYRFEIYDFLEATPSSPPSTPPEPAVVDSPSSSSPSSPSSSSSSPSSSSGKNKWIIPVCIVVAFVILGAMCGLFLWKRKIKGRIHLEKQASFQHQFLGTGKMFSLEELKEATSHFHESNKLGQGGFGIVYRGRLSRVGDIAVKKLKSEKIQGTQEFVNEVNLITSVHHKNLIKLLGYCAEGDEKILVYEYFPNGSLDSFVHKRGMVLTWSMRYKIILGMAKGLQYLHEDSPHRIIHRDIKPSNILLDKHLDAIIADFGTARLMSNDETHVHTGVAGTRGYVAPEYAMNNVLTEKADVYSFGLVTLELVTGAQNGPGDALRLAWQKWPQGNTLELADNKMRDAFSPEEVVQVVHVALLCTQEDPRQRPRMSEVTQLLSGVSSILEMPIKPAYVDYLEPSLRTHQRISADSFSSTNRHYRDTEELLSASDIIEAR